MSLASIFLDFNLNPTTWFYCSLLLAVALFFKFTRVLSVRNWDVLTLFLLAPGFLLLEEAKGWPDRWRYYLSGAYALPPAGQGSLQATPMRQLAYVWLLGVSGYFFVRCLLDLTLVRRPALKPNLNLAGLTWLAAALFACLIWVALRPLPGPVETVGKEAPAVRVAKQGVDEVVNHQTPTGQVTGLDTQFWVDRSLAIFCHLLVVAGLVVVGWRHYQDSHAGVAAATLYLLLPYAALQVSQVHHVWPSALLVWTVAVYRWPLAAGILLGLAAASAYFPALLFPLFFSFYRRRGAGRFAAAFVLAAGLSLVLIGAILWAQGDLATSLKSALHLSDWQPWKEPSSDSFWKGVHWAYRLPVFVAYLAFLLLTAFWPMPKNLAHVLALASALLIGIQFWHADQGGVYVLWYLPLLLLLLFRPNLGDRSPPVIAPETDWVVRSGRWLKRLAGRPLRLPEPAVGVR